MRHKSKRNHLNKTKCECNTLKINYAINIQIGDKTGMGSFVNGKPLKFYLGMWHDSQNYNCISIDDTCKGSFCIDVHSGMSDTLKLELLARILDDSTGIEKASPIDASFACMRQLCSGKEVSVTLTDPFAPNNLTQLTLTPENSVDSSLLTKSSYYDVNQHNSALEEMSNHIKDCITSNKLHEPSISQAFESGVTYFTAGGNDSLGVKPVQTNYAVLNKYIMNCDRSFPHPFVLVCLHQTMHNYGLSPCDVLSMDDRNFANFVGHVICGATHDAGLQPYAYDVTLGNCITLDLSKTPPIQMEMAPVMTENIGMCMAASQFVERKFGDISETDVNLQNKSILQIWEDMNQKSWDEYNLSANQDDCETDFMTSQILTKTIKLENMSASKLHEECAGVKCLKHYSMDDYEQASKILTRVQEMLTSGKINVSSAVGLAGAASASATSKALKSVGEDIDQCQNLSGHCFGILQYQGDNDELYVRLLEGTTTSYPYKCTPNSAVYTTKDNKTKLRLDHFLGVLGTTVKQKLQVCNAEYGEGSSMVGGWDGPQSQRCLCRTTMVVPCLHSENVQCGKTSKDMGGGAVEMPFYQWIVFTGQTCDNEVIGCMPLDEDEHQNQVCAGCRPVSLIKKNLRGVCASMKQETVEMGQKIFNEVMPPMVSKDTMKKLMDMWNPLPPLSTLNQGVKDLKKEGLTYYTTCFMETPSSPFLTPYIYYAKKKVADAFNQLNLNDPNSDKIFMTVGYTATSVSVVMHVPDVSQTISCVSNLNVALKNVGWPSSKNNCNLVLK